MIFGKGQVGQFGDWDGEYGILPSLCKYMVISNGNIARWIYFESNVELRVAGEDVDGIPVEDVVEVVAINCMELVSNLKLDNCTE